MPAPLHKQIETTRETLMRVKPRSRRRVEIELTLRDLMVRQLRRENKNDRKTNHTERTRV